MKRSKELKKERRANQTRWARARAIPTRGCRVGGRGRPTGAARDGRPAGQIQVACRKSRRITARDFSCMAFNLKKVLKALLLSSSQPLATKDIQAAFTRFHEQATLAYEPDVEGAPPGASPTEQAAAASAPDADQPAPAVPAAAPGAEEVVEIVADPGSRDPELYTDVPSLITATQIREAMDQIAADLRAADDGLLLIEGNAGFRIVTHPRFGRWIRILRQEPPPVKLSQSAIETLAVIAYRQPVTRGEIETIRGVSAEAGVNKLLERELIYIVGRADAPGRPIQYGTTDQFLEFVGIKSLDEMPASDVLSSRQIDEWLKTSSNTHTPTDTDMGLADEQLPLDATAPIEASPAPAEPAAETEAKPAPAAPEASAQS
jgi:segregation and condensation protein B